MEIRPGIFGSGYTAWNHAVKNFKQLSNDKNMQICWGLNQQIEYNNKILWVLLTISVMSKGQTTLGHPISNSHQRESRFSRIFLQISLLGLDLGPFQSYFHFSKKSGSITNSLCTYQIRVKAQNFHFSNSRRGLHPNYKEGKISWLLVKG